MPSRIMESNSQLHTGLPKIQIVHLQVLSKCILNSSTWDHDH